MSITLLVVAAGNHLVLANEIEADSLRPSDTSSPRDTLSSFLEDSDRVYQAGLDDRELDLLFIADRLQLIESLGRDGEHHALLRLAQPDLGGAETGVLQRYRLELDARADSARVRSRADESDTQPVRVARTCSVPDAVNHESKRRNSRHAFAVTALMSRRRRAGR